MNVLYEGHLDDKTKNKGKNADFKVGEFQDFNGSNNDADAYDVVDDPVFVGEVVTESNTDPHKKTHNVKDSNFEEILNLKAFLK